MQCAHCGFGNPPGFTFCGKCGKSLSVTCSRCGAAIPPDFAFCGKCGTPVRPPADSLSATDLDHLRVYLPPTLIEPLRFDPIAPEPSLLGQCLAHLHRLLNVTQSHLPAYLAERVLHDPQPGHNDGQFVNGTLLFADISGFTAMSERLSRVGREGAEEITTIVNRYFNLMLAILREREGHLIKFGGDALLALFLESNGQQALSTSSLKNKSDSATRAAQAALTMQAAMSEFAQTNTSQGIFPLQMKVAVHRGRFFSAQLGTAQGMEQMLFGSHVNLTAAIESVASAGQVVLDLPTLNGLAVPHRATPLMADLPCAALEQIEGVSLRMPQLSGTKPLKFSLEPTLTNLKHTIKQLDALTPYLPVGLLSRIAHNPQSVLEGEHRLVALLFTNVHGLGEIVDRLGPGHEPQIITALNQYFVAMEHSLRQFGGIVNKMDLYEHGDKLMAMFGAPIAHEDDAERAVRGALAMQETLAAIAESVPATAGINDLRLKQSIGISYGYVFAGYVGTGWRHEYTVMGDEVNLAARLMTAAGHLQPEAATGGHVVVSGNVQRKTQALFDFEMRGEVSLKGKSNPVPIFAVNGARAMPASVRGLEGMRSALVGRESEWQQLQNALNQLLSGRGQIVSVMGEAGLGKSRLVAELRAHLADDQRLNGRQPRWHEGRCLSYTENVSYTPFYDLLRNLIGFRSDDGEEIAWNALREAIHTQLTPEDAQQHQPYLTQFFNFKLSADMQERVRYLDAEALQRRTFVALSALIEAYAQRRPLIVVLDDIHWIDQASQQLLEYLLPLVNRAPIMFLLLYRPDRDRRCWQIHDKIVREYGYCASEVVLQKLSDDESQQLLINLVQFDRWPLETQQRILSRTEGNPLYLEEVIRTLIDAQLLVKNERDEWIASDAVATAQVPDTLQGVIMARLDRLPEASRWTAQIASVIGRVFAYDILNELTEQQQQLMEHLAQLQQHEISREMQRLPEVLYAFKHGMIQEVCYNSLLVRVRRQSHRKIAAYLENLLATRQRDVENMHALIAHHAFEGQDWPRALKYQLLSGLQAQRLFANQAAIAYLQRAMQAAEQLPAAQTEEQRLISQAALGELLTTTGQYDQALTYLDAALELARAHGNTDMQAHLCRWRGRLHELRGEYAPAFEWLERGLTLLGERETAEAAQLRLIAGLIHSRQGQHEQAYERGQQALQIAQKVDEVTVRARAYLLLGHISLLRGQTEAAIENFTHALELYERAGDLSGQASAHNQSANAQLVMGRWAAASESYSQARDIFAQLGDIYRCAITDNNIGEVALKRGELDAALNAYQSALSALERLGSSLYVRGVLHNNLGATLIRRGEAGQAREHLRQSQAYFEQAKARDFLPELNRHWAEAALLSDEPVMAEEHATQAVQLARELKMRGQEGSALRVLGEAAMARGDHARALEQLSESINVLQAVGDEYERARSELVLAQVFLARRESSASRAALESSKQVFEKLGAALDLEAVHDLLVQLATAW